MFYYEVLYRDFYDDEDTRVYTCSYSKELKKGQHVILEHSGRYIVCKITTCLDEVDVIIQKLSVREIVNVVDDTEYLSNKANRIKKQSILEQMEDISKDVQVIEKMKKLADKDPRMKALLRQYEQLDDVRDLLIE